MRISQLARFPFRARAACVQLDGWRLSDACLEGRAAGRGAGDFQAGRDPLFDLGDVGDDANCSTAGLDVLHGFDRFVERVGVQRSESLVQDQHLVDVAGGPPTLAGDVGEAESEGEAGEELLSARQGAGVACPTGVGIEDFEVEAPRSASAAGRSVAPSDRVPALAHAGQVDVADVGYSLQLGGEHPSGQRHPCRSFAGAHRVDFAFERGLAGQ